MARTATVRDVEPLPEADRLEGFPHPRQTDALFGHEEEEQELAVALARGEVHHGWLFAGPPGIGKATLAYRLAKCLLASPTERQLESGSLMVPQHSQANRQVLALSHPGLMVLRRPYDQKNKRFKTSIPVDEVRRLRSFLTHRAVDGGWRVVIVDSADDLNLNAANALLKSLEEPPPRLVFLLISSEPGRLLTTIRSRCRRLTLTPLGRQPLLAAAEQAFAAGDVEAPSGDVMERLGEMAQGSVRRLIGLHSAGGLEIHDAIVEIFSGLPEVRWSRVHDLAGSLGVPAAGEKYTLYHELLFDHLARVIRQAAIEEAGGGGAAGSKALIQPGRLASWAALWETLVREEAETRALNLDRKAFILGTIQRIEAAARR
jgi:DNA polymerase III subunit delta'